MLENKTISKITRTKLFEEILLASQDSFENPISGNMDLDKFLKRIFPLDEMPSTDPRFQTATEDIWKHMVMNNDWDYLYLLGEYLGVINGPDDQFVKFIEEMVHPIIRKETEQEKYVAIINRHIERDGYKLQSYAQISGYAVYSVVARNSGKLENEIKNLVFASDGPKPEIVITDMLSNEIKIVKYENHCLIYNKPIAENGLSWGDLKSWWIENQNGTGSKADIELYNRLVKSLPTSSPPERLLFDTYMRKIDPISDDKLPVLLPQVYLHYDPYTFRELHGAKNLVRQRMDFLILFSKFERVVIEVDGKQHYSDNNVPSPQKYAEMVAEDRRIRLAGYELYRFGGYELQGQNGEKIAEEFFKMLMAKHKIRIK